MAKNVQIPEDLFYDLCRYFFCKLDDIDMEIVAENIENGLKTKLYAIQKRAAYSAYKDTSKSPEERQAARREYLDLVGMLPGFRWDSLDPPT